MDEPWVLPRLPPPYKLCFSSEILLHVTAAILFLTREAAHTSAPSRLFVLIHHRTPLEKNCTFLFCKLVTVIHQLRRLFLEVRSGDIVCVISEEHPFRFRSVLQLTKCT